MINLKSLIILLIILIFIKSYAQNPDQKIQPLIWAENQDNISFNLETAFTLEELYGFEKTNKAKRRLEKIFKDFTKSIEVKNNYTKDDAKIFFKTLNNILNKYGLWTKDLGSITDGLLMDKDRLYFDCDQLSLIYIDFAKRINLSVKAVYSQNHMFVRWISSDSTYLNWDPVAGSSIPDYFYSASEISVSKGVYLKSLNRVEQDTKILRISTLSHHRTYRPVYGGSLNMAESFVNACQWNIPSPY